MILKLSFSLCAELPLAYTSQNLKTWVTRPTRGTRLVLVASHSEISDRSVLSPITER
jgi:hypothetical protein